MINQLIEFSLRQRLFVVIATACMAVVGIGSAWKLPIDAVPDITNVQVQVNTDVPALAPEEIEKLVTFPIEVEMGGIEGLTEMRSLSKFGLSQVTLVFDDGVDIYRARQLVSERLQNALENIPPGLQPKLAPITTGLGEIYFYTLDYLPDARDKPADRRAQLMELKQIHDWIIKPQLRTVRGVAEVNSSGGYEKQIVIQPDARKMMSAGLGFEELADIIHENVENAGGGAVQKAGEQILLRVSGRVQNAEQIAALPVKFRASATPLLVRDVADVAIGSSMRTGAATREGEEGLLGTALMLAGENSRRVSDRVREKLGEIQSKLPPGVAIRTEYDRSELVNQTIWTVEKNLFEGAVLVIAVLLALLGNWRASLIVASAIPLSMLFAFTGMVQCRISGNLMSLGAIDFGLIVDGAVVMVENVVRRLGMRQHQLGRVLSIEERHHTILAACTEVARPVVFAVGIITVVYVPILALTGIEGKMFHPMAMTVMMALVGALLISITFVPVLCSYFLTGRIAERENRVMAWFRRSYEPSLAWALNHRFQVVAGSVALFAASLGVFWGIGAEFAPQLDEGSFATHMIRTTSSGLDASLELQKKAEKVLLERFPEIDRTFSRIGTPEVATDPMGVNVSDTYIFFTPREKWRKINGRRATKDDLAELMIQDLNIHVPGQAYLFSQPIEMRFNELLEGTRADVAVKIFGDDFEVLEKLAGEIREVLETIPGAADVEFDAVGKAPLLDITPNREAMQKYNLHAEEINAAVSTALGGAEVGSIIEGNRRYDVVVRLSEASRQQLEEMKNLPVRTREGGLISLGTVAQFDFVEKVNAITREAGQRRVAVLVNLRGRDVDGFVREASRKIGEQVKMPPGYYVEFGGQFKNLRDAKVRLMIVVPAALILIFILIFAAFGSLRQAALVYSGIPLAVTGGIFALALRGMPFSVSAAIGFIALSGVAVLNGVVLISFFNLLREEGRDLATAVFEGAVTRLRPILMTAFVASLGFVPMALAGGTGAEVQRPLATVVIGGIISSTFLTLVLLPVLYQWTEGRVRRNP